MAIVTFEAQFCIMLKEPVTKSLIKSFAEQKQIFEFNSELLLHDEDPEVIHQMRLSLKRIRSIQGFVEYISPSHPVKQKQIRKLDTVFELSGYVRDNQVQLHDLHHLQEGLQFNFTRYEKYLLKRIAESREDFVEKVLKYEAGFLDKLYVAFIAFLYSRSEKDVQENYRSILEENYESLMHSLQHLPDTTKGLHSLRKKVKDYINLYGLLDAEKSGRGKATFVHFKRLDQALGHWHDLINTQQRLKVFYKNNPVLIQKKEEYLVLWQYIEDEISASREEIDAILREGLHSL